MCTDGCSVSLALSCPQACLSLLQSLLRELVPDSFPARLGPDCGAPGTTQRRFIIIDEAVYALYGEQMDKVIAAHLSCTSARAGLQILMAAAEIQLCPRHHSRSGTALWAEKD